MLYGGGFLIALAEAYLVQNRLRCFSPTPLWRIPAITKPKLTPIESKEIDIKIVMAVPPEPAQLTGTIIQCRLIAVVQTHHLYLSPEQFCPSVSAIPGPLPPT
jgi:hypothetical protein